MSRRQLKYGYFVLEGLNSFATVYYVYYVYFLMQKVFAFGNEANLILAAWNGLVVMIGAWQGGKMAQRFGYFFALKAGFLVMFVALSIGAFVVTARAHIAVMTVMMAGMCLTWPTLEALVSEGETRAGLQDMVGLYNVVWAGTSAIAYFFGGAVIAHLGFPSMYYLPAASMAAQLALTFWLEKRVQVVPVPSRVGDRVGSVGELNPHPASRTKMFLRMAWLANPFAYIAINTTLALVPSVADRFGLSTTLAGFYCSIWCFVRVAAFYGLWRWDGWHYRFRWLLAAYVGLVVSFLLVVLARHLFLFIAAQLFFGAALGLVYYSSLFYSMDLSDTKGAHGGLHEAAIGAGNFAGPAVGAASLHFFPQYANSGVLAVGVLLLMGLGGLCAVRLNAR
jgi:predicted MFS family arabinose efflux permease